LTDKSDILENGTKAVINPADAIPLDVTYRAVEDLVPYEQNSRKHSKRQIEALRASIRQFGIRKPLVIWQNNTILAGHGTLEAAKAEGHTSVPCVDASHLPFSKARAFVIADNKTADLGEFDAEVLNSELHALDGINMPFSLSDLGFSDSELETLMVDVDVEITSDQEKRPSTSELAKNKKVIVTAAPTNAPSDFTDDETPKSQISKPQTQSKTVKTENSSHSPYPKPSIANDKISPGQRTPIYGHNIIYAGQEWALGSHILTCADTETRSDLNAFYDVLCRWRTSQGLPPVLKDYDTEIDLTLTEVESSYTDSIKALQTNPINPEAEYDTPPASNMDAGVADAVKGAAA